MILDSGGDDTRFDWLRQWKWDPDAPSARITITNGHGTGQFAVGTMAEIVAKPRSGYEFSEWIVESGDVKLVDPLSSFTTFTVPSGGAIITATYQPIDMEVDLVSHSFGGLPAVDPIGDEVLMVLTVKDMIIIFLMALNIGFVICQCGLRCRRKDHYERVTAAMDSESEMDSEMDSEIEK